MKGREIRRREKRGGPGGIWGFGQFHGVGKGPPRFDTQQPAASSTDEAPPGEQKSHQGPGSEFTPPQSPYENGRK